MDTPDARSRILLLTPTGRDAILISEALSRHSIAAQCCSSTSQLVTEIERGAAAIMIAEEALSPQTLECLGAAISAQPPWSDLPVLILSAGGESTPFVEQRLNQYALLRNVTVVERPVRPATLLTLVQTAIRARRRQYEVERLLHDLSIAEERLRTMIESAQDYAIINLDTESRITYWNAGAQRLLGHKEEDIAGLSYDLIFSDEDRESGVPARELNTASRVGRAESEGWRIRADGTRFWASGVVRPIRCNSGSITGFVKVVRDITERKRSEEMLQRSNEDLQRFAYVASHDLQEPLRMISSYSQLLARKNEGRLAEESQGYVKFIVSGVERMRTLIHDLLEFSRLTSTEAPPPEPVDCNEVLGLALEQLQYKISESGARVSFDHLPIVMGHASRLLQVFQNLIGNSLKYNKRTPQIKISATQHGDSWWIEIKDNGIGIAPEYQKKIFGLFERLHSRSEYPGTGIGLATCKRIVEQMHGRIWVESVEGQGSTFYLSLPAADSP